MKWFEFLNPLKSFRSKLFLCFIVCSVIPVSIVGIISYNTSYDIAKNKIIETTELSSRQISYSIENRIVQIENVADSIQFNLYVLSKTPTKPMSAYLDAYEQVKSNISSLGTAFGIKHIASFVDTSILISQERFSFYGLSDLDIYNIKEEQLLNLGIEYIWEYNAEQQYPYDISRQPVPSLILFGGKPNTNNKSLEYAYAICLDTSEFTTLLNSSYIDNNIIAQLVDTKNGTIISGSDKNLPDAVLDKIKNNESRYSDNNSEYLIHHINNSDWALVTNISNSYISQNTGALVKIMLIALGFIIIITFVVTIFVSKTLTKKLNKFTKIIRRSSDYNYIETDLLEKDLQYSIDNGDEIDTLIITFKDMMKTIQTNFNEILNMSIKEEKLKYQLLQSQINPHFLYNALNSIQNCQSVGKIKIANEMTIGLAKFYRYILRKNDDLITISSELEIVELYLKLESLSHNEYLSWDIQKDEGIENFMICKFTLQPVIENCIVHGIKSSTKPFNIDIDIKFGDDDIIFIIKDNGCGIKEDTLKDIQNTLDKKIVSYDKHFGLGNINARINKALGGRLEMESVENQGSVVKIIIPQIL